MPLPNGVPLYVANTHLHARYRTNRYHATQLAQATQLLPWLDRVRSTGAPALWLGDWNSEIGDDILSPLIAAGPWRLLDSTDPHIDHIFGSSSGWIWKVTAQGEKNGFLKGEPQVPWSDHPVRWVDVQLLKTS